MKTAQHLCADCNTHPTDPHISATFAKNAELTQTERFWKPIQNGFALPSWPHLQEPVLLPHHAEQWEPNLLEKIALGHLPPKISLATCSPLPSAAALLFALSVCALLWLCYGYCALVCTATLWLSGCLLCSLGSSVCPCRNSMKIGLITRLPSWRKLTVPKKRLGWPQWPVCVLSHFKRYVFSLFV